MRTMVANLGTRFSPPSVFNRSTRCRSGGFDCMFALNPCTWECTGLAQHHHGCFTGDITFDEVLDTGESVSGIFPHLPFMKCFARAWGQDSVCLTVVEVCLRYRTLRRPAKVMLLCWLSSKRRADVPYRSALPAYTRLPLVQSPLRSSSQSTPQFGRILSEGSLSCELADLPLCLSQSRTHPRERPSGRGSSGKGPLLAQE